MNNKFDVEEYFRKQDEKREEDKRKRMVSRKMNFIRSCLEVEGDLTLNFTTTKKDGSYLFSGYKIEDEKPIHISIDRHQVESLGECDSIQEMLDCYREMEYYPDVISK